MCEPPYQILEREELIRPAIPLTIVLLCILFVIVNLFASFRWMQKEELSIFVQGAALPQGAVRVVVTSDAYKTDFQSYVLAKIEIGDFKGRGIKLVLRAEDEIPPLGTQLQVRGDYKRRGFEAYDRWLYNKGVYYECRVKLISSEGFGRGFGASLHRLRASLLADFASLSLDNREQQLLEAILLGERSDNEQNAEPFRRSGLSHLLAVSGSHLSILAAFIAFILGPGISSKARILVVLPLCLAFHVISGAQDSSLRALIMLFLVSLARMGKRRADPLHSMGLGASMLIIFKPRLALSLGFQMSCLAIFGIFIFLPLIQAWMKALFPYLPYALNSALSMALIGQSACLPVSLPAFQEISLISPLANLAALPLMSLSLSAAVLGSILLKLFRPLGILVISLSEYALHLLIWIADRCAALPWAILKVTYLDTYLSYALILFFLVLYLWWPSPKINRQFSSRTRLLVWRVLSLALFFTAFSLAVFPELFKPIEVLLPEAPKIEQGIYVLDVGQGDANLIIGEEKTALVDAGPDEGALLKALAELKVRRIDTLYFTHLHSDHFAGAFALDKFQVKEIVVALGSGESKEARALSRHLKADIREIGDDDIEQIGQFSMEVYGPNARVRNPKANEASLILFVDDKPAASPNSNSLLITGDAEAWQVLSAFSDEDAVPAIDVLKVGHHGSSGSLSPSLLSKLKPLLAAISVGKDNSYGHPKDSTLKLLERYKIPVLRTDLHGSISLGYK